MYLGSIHQVRKEAPTRIPFDPPPPLEEFDDAADKIAHTEWSTRHSGIRSFQSAAKSVNVYLSFPDDLFSR
jgi:hypothetical protein